MAAQQFTKTSSSAERPPELLAPQAVEVCSIEVTLLRPARLTYDPAPRHRHRGSPCDGVRPYPPAMVDMIDPLATEVNRSTRWRSAVIGGCMIIVPLCAIFGAGLSKLIAPNPVKKRNPAANKSASSSQQKQDTTLLGAAFAPSAPGKAAAPSINVTGVSHDPTPNTLPTTSHPSASPVASVPAPSPMTSSNTMPRGSLVPSIPTRNPPILATAVEPLPPLPIIRPDPQIRLVSEPAPSTTTPPIEAQTPPPPIAMSTSATSPTHPATTIYAGGSSGQTGQNPELRTDWFTRTQQRLREFGATYYVLEATGPKGDQFRFHCKIALPNSPGFERHFEATDVDATKAMQNVLQQVEAWRNGVQ